MRAGGTGGPRGPTSSRAESLRALLGMLCMRGGLSPWACLLGRFCQPGSSGNSRRPPSLFCCSVFQPWSLGTPSLSSWVPLTDPKSECACVGGPSDWGEHTEAWCAPGRVVLKTS